MPNIKVNGITLHYQERGRGEPLVLIMGLGADHSVWEQHVAAYSRHFRCILPDNRGVGLSAKPKGPYTTAMMADDAAALISALDIRQAHISGISMGGAIAQELALRHPGYVRSLTLNCTWPRCDAYLARIVESLQELYGKINARAWIRHLYLLIFSPEYHRKHLADLLAREKQALRLKKVSQPAYAYAAQCDACITHDTLARLQKISAPTLITVGDKDIFTPRHFAEDMHRRIPKSRLEVFPGGHAHHWEQLKKFNAMTLSFMKKHSVS
jgi:pimeloyl-ACP methyl ester carboxylesterase